MPTSAREEVANSPKASVKAVHSARADVGIGPYRREFGGVCESRPQQALVKGEQRLVDLVNVVVPLADEILDDHVELAAAAEGIARAGYEIAGFVQIQFQRDGKGEGRGLGRPVVRVAADLGEQLAVDVGPLVDLGILFAAAVDVRQQRFGKSGVQMPQPVVQTAEGPGDGRERRAWSSAGGPYVFVGDRIRVRTRADKIRMRCGRK